MPYIELDVLNNAPPPVLGIDLGTTNSLVAIYQGDRPLVLRPDGKSGRIPSALYFGSNGKVEVGEKARERALVDPADTIFSIKRFMGRGLEDVRDDLNEVPFEASENEHGLIQFDVHGRKYTPQEISAMVLRRIHQAACELVEGPQPSQAVITVPAYFDDAQRQATRDAARLAGLEVLRIVNEPTAASLAYGLDQRSAGTIVVYDLGGGTFDVSVLSIEDGVFRVLSTAGDTHLGGDDFDRGLVDIALDEMRDKVSAEVLDDPSLRQGLRLAAEHAKQELTRDPEADFHLAIPQAGINYHHRVTRAQFEELTRPLVDRTFDACRRALADAGVELKDVDEVVLVGGSTRMPVVRKRVEEFFGRTPHTELDPDEVVALGAAVQAHVLAGGTRDILLMDVTPLSLGMETMGGAISKIIERNSPIPHQATEVFTTYADNQTGIDFHIVQGERELAQDCRSLGRFKLTGIPPRPAGLARVAVRFALDANGMLNVRATEESTGVSANIDVQPAHGLTDDQVETMLHDSYENAQADFDARRVADLKTEIEIMLRATSGHIADAETALDPESVQDIKDAISSAEAACETLDLELIQSARDELERATLPLASVLMNQVAQTSLAGKNLSDV